MKKIFLMSKRRPNRIPRTKVKCEEYENLVQKQTNRNPMIKIKCQEYENLGTDGGTKSDEFSEKFQIFIAYFGSF